MYCTRDSRGMTPAPGEQRFPFRPDVAVFGEHLRCDRVRFKHYQEKEAGRCRGVGMAGRGSETRLTSGNRVVVVRANERPRSLVSKSRRSQLGPHIRPPRPLRRVTHPHTSQTTRPPEAVPFRRPAPVVLARLGEQPPFGVGCGLIRFERRCGNGATGGISPNAPAVSGFPSSTLFTAR